MHFVSKIKPFDLEIIEDRSPIINLVGGSVPEPAAVVMGQLILLSTQVVC